MLMSDDDNNVPIEIMEIFNYQGNLLYRTEIKRPDLLYKNQRPHIGCDNCNECEQSLTC